MSPFEALLGHKAEFGTEILKLDKAMLEGVRYEHELERRLGYENVQEYDYDDVPEETENNNSFEHIEPRTAPVLEGTNDVQTFDFMENDIPILGANLVIEAPMFEANQETQVLDTMENMEIDYVLWGNDEIVEDSSNVDRNSANNNGTIQLNNCPSCSDPVYQEDIPQPQCQQCELFCHNKCITELNLCSLCKSQQSIKEHRIQANKQQKIGAGKMTEKSCRRFGEAKLHDTVLVPVPPVDRGRLEALNLLAIVLKAEGGLYKLGTRTGVLLGQFTRNQFNPCKHRFLEVEDVNMEKIVSVRTSAKNESEGDGQGMLKCNCKGKCLNARCKCKQNGMLCNSRCHNSGPCSNK